MYEVQKRILSTFNKEAYKAFVQHLLSNSYENETEKFISNKKISLPYFVRYQEDGRYEVYEHHYLTSFYFFNRTNIKKRFITPGIKKAVGQILKNKLDNTPKDWRTHYLGKIYLMTNLYEFQESDYEEFFSRLNLIDVEASFGIGSIDTFLEQNPEEVDSYLKKFFATSYDGIALSVKRDYVEAKAYFTENIFSSGILPDSKLPLESVVTTNILNQFYLIEEFNEVINLGNERRIEEFIRANYSLVFGKQYDRIEAQIWLKFPELDIDKRNRRLDLFAHNSVSNDWELFELKADLNIVTNTRGVPSLTRAVHTAISQSKNYHKLLQQDSVKRKLKQEGIEYFEPTINIVIGRKPQLTQDKWRRLLSEHRDINLLTYDNLIKEMKLNIEDKIQFIGTN